MILKKSTDFRHLKYEMILRFGLMVYQVTRKLSGLAHFKPVNRKLSIKQFS